MSYNFDKPPLVRMPSIARKRLCLERASLMRLSTFAIDKFSPLVVQPTVSGLDTITWAEDNIKFIESELARYGAILFRGFDIATEENFNQFVRAIGGEPLEYRERSSPRSQVVGRIYTSTDYPANQVIFPHNEHSYAKVFPLKLFFFCKHPAYTGGETPLSDCRRILQRLDSQIRERFVQKKWMYVRNFGDGIGLSWQQAFQTEDRGEVEKYCRSFDIQVEWKKPNRLRTRQVRPAIVQHPRTGELVWFNHATFFHISTLPISVREKLLAEFEEADLPNNTYYGDGSPIEPDVLCELREAYLQESTSFVWEQSDVILLDNISIAHARNPYTGPRQILFAMVEPYDREDI
jgi:alpha-ketoglutarate-dependent taurine dioxygenase